MTGGAEYLVVGSGPSGAMAAQTLVEAGKHVVMLDVGETSPESERTIPEKDFITLRKTDPEQYKYFIGETLEGVAWGDVGKGEQLTPPRKHILQSVDRLIPALSKSFSTFESLGYGGLGIGWGIGCWEWSDKELRAAGLDPKPMQAAYNTVCKRIGISAADDGASAYTIRSLRGYQPAADMDRNHQLLYKKYAGRAADFKKSGLIMGRAPLALLTEDQGGRKGYSYKDMDFYSDKDGSAYRPWMTIDELRQQANFTYINKRLVLSFSEEKDGVMVRCLHTDTNKTETFRAKKLVLASGVLGTARIVLRSFSQPTARLPILCNPYSYIPCIQPACMGKEAERHKLGFAQLSFFLDESGENFGAAMASLYSYQSLMLFRMIRQVPSNFVDARLLLRYLVSGIIIMGIHQPDTPSKEKYLTLEGDVQSPTGDSLRITYAASDEERALRTRREKKYMRAMRGLGAYPIKRIDPGMGSSIHYAGALPMSTEPRPYTLHNDGQLHGTRHVYVVDASGFNYLAAKGLTFTLMANAHRIAERLARS